MFQATRKSWKTWATSVRQPADRHRAPARPPIRVLACPARDEADRLALEMLAQLLDSKRWVVEIAGADTLTGELLEHAAEDARRD